jgi:hypothetical protein
MPESSSNFLDTTTYAQLTVVDGRVLLASGEFSSARELVARTRAVLQGLGIRVSGPVLMQIEAEALLAMGHREDALLLLRQAAGEARTMNARRQLWPVLGLLARLAAEDGDELDAAALRQEARACIELMAGDLDELWRQEFLSLPEVREAAGF